MFPQKLEQREMWNTDICQTPNVCGVCVSCTQCQTKEVGKDRLLLPTRQGFKSNQLLLALEWTSNSLPHLFISHMPLLVAE